MSKYKRDVKFWEQYKGTLIRDGAEKEIKRLTKMYNKHRAKSNKKADS